MSASSSPTASAAAVGSAPKTMGFPNIPRYHPTASAGNIPWVWDGFAREGQGQVAARIVGVGLMPAIVRNTTDKGVRVELWLRDPAYWQENKLTEEMVQALSQFRILAPHQLMALDHYHAYRIGRLYICPGDIIYEATQRQVKADEEKEEKAHLAKQEKKKQMAAALSGSKRKTKADATVATAAATAASAAAPDAVVAAGTAAPNAAPTAAPAVAVAKSARSAKRLRK